MLALVESQSHSGEGRIGIGRERPWRWRNHHSYFMCRGGGSRRRRRSIQRTKPEKILLPQHTTTRESGGCSFFLPPFLPRFSLSFVCVAVRTFTSPRRHAHIADDRARKITWRCHRLGRSPPESAYRCRHHMGNVAHWKRSLQLYLYLRSNIIRLSRRST